MMSLVDDKKISRDEFDILEKVSKNVKETNYLNHFKAADSTHDGYVTAEEMEQRFKQLGRGVSRALDAVRTFIQKNDQDNDGKLNYNCKLKLNPTLKA